MPAKKPVQQKRTGGTLPHRDDDDPSLDEDVVYLKQQLSEIQKRLGEQIAINQNQAYINQRIDFLLQDQRRINNANDNVITELQRMVKQLASMNGEVVGKQNTYQSQVKQGQRDTTPDFSFPHLTTKTGGKRKHKK